MPHKDKLIMLCEKEAVPTEVRWWQTVGSKEEEYFYIEEIFEIFGGVEFVVPQGVIFTFTKKVIVSASMSLS